ncbi:putative proteinase inhibitor I20 [Rosa chinensis]|uniref:Uncharacterized protein n=1 Tax=Rosa chinensis TaxID=74649 RepID=A0A2P6PET9_ROSCH|nr:putative proteinase inhibitor I20 [Rosa chinensis]
MCMHVHKGFCSIMRVDVYAGSIILGGIPTEAKVCPLICYDVAAYMTCPSSGNEHLSPLCNCCLASEPGCAIYLSDGTRLCTST